MPRAEAWAAMLALIALDLNISKWDSDAQYVVRNVVNCVAMMTISELYVNAL